MRIQQISVTNLFGIFNHTISLNMEERITIVHGPNGFGKTVLLRMLNGIFNSRYAELRTIPFKELRVNFENESNILVTRYVDMDSNNKSRNELTFTFFKQDSEPHIFSEIFWENTNEIDVKLEVLENRKKANTNQAIMLSILDSFHNLDWENLPRVKNEPDWLLELRKSINVRLIEAQRLLNISDIPRTRADISRPQMIESVATYSEELAENIQAKLAEYGELSQSLDRSFPARVVNQKSPSNLTDETLRNKLSELEEKRSRIIETGLLDKDENSDFKVEQQIIDEPTKSLLSVYVEDAEKKLSVFQEITKKIDLFKRIIQDRFLYKKMTISKENGFTFTSADGNPLSPTGLSSGEQHELVMLYELLFKTKPGSLILIDEPELSLHVAWQVQFLKDLQEITQLANFDVLIATHSPDIINDRWDLTVELKGLDK